MFVHYRSHGFILKKENLGESDQLFTIYTKDFGKLKVLGKAIRKIKSKLRGETDIFYLSEIEFIQGKAYKTLTDTILIEKFKNLRKDLKRLRIINKISEVFDELVRGQEKDENLWELILETFEKLNVSSLPTISCLLIYYYFFWNLISILGYRPELYKCSSCQKKIITENLYFDQREGGIVCDQCFPKFKQGKKVDRETIKIIRIFLRRDWQTLKKLKITADNLKILKEISDYFLLSLRKSIFGHI